jgi:hypothetical protein
MVAFRIRQLAGTTRLIEGQLDINRPSPTRESRLLLVHQVH